MTSNPVIYTGFQAQNPVILVSFSSLLSFSTILSIYLDVTKHFGTNILPKIQLSPKCSISRDNVRNSYFKDYFLSDWWRSRLGSWLDLRSIVSKLGSKIRKSPSRFLTRKDGVAGAILRARLRRRTVAKIKITPNP